MKIITTISDLRNLVDGWSGSEGLATDNASHDENVKIVARLISDDAHAAGLSYGDDWSAFLADIKPVWEYLD